MDENMPAARTFAAAPAGAGLPDPLAGLRIADAHLERVLRGQDYLVQDGAMGTLLQERGLTAHGELPDLLNFSDPDAIADIHAGYVRAGAEMITTNTFSANAHKLAGSGLAPEEAIAAGVRCAKEAAKAFDGAYVGLDIGPIGELLFPMGQLAFDEAYE